MAKCRRCNRDITRNQGRFPLQCTLAVPNAAAFQFLVSLVEGVDFLLFSWV